MITAALALDVSKFNKGIADARAGINSLAGQATAFGGPISTLFGRLDSGLAMLGKLGQSPAGAALMGIAAGAAAAGIAAKGMWDAMSRADELNTLSEQAGLSVQEFMTLEKVLSNAGLKAERIPSIMDSLSSAMQSASGETGEAAIALQKLNLNFAEISASKGVDQILKINKAINQLNDDALKIQLRKIFFGKAGIAAGPEMTEEKIAKSSAAVAPMADIFDRFGGVFAAFQSNVKKLSASFEPFFLGMASQVIPTLIGATKSLEAVAPKLLSAGVVFGENVAVAAVVLSDVIDKWNLIFKVTGERNLTQQTGGAAFMGMGGFGMGTATGLSESAVTAEASDTEGFFKSAREKVRKNIKDSIAEFGKPQPDNGFDTGNQMLGGMGKGADVFAGLSSLAKMGAIGGGGMPTEDPIAMRSVSIQEDIRNYMRDLVNIVKSPENLSIQSSGTGMVLAS